jgi:hypothetical protein
MNRVIVLGLLGRAGSGKSTAAAYLRDKYGAQIHSFAQPLKDLAKEVFEFSEGQVRGTQAMKEAIDPRYGFSPRDALIRLGDGARRHIGERVWIEACFNKIEEERDWWPLHVIEDVRYPNEAEAIWRLSVTHEKLTGVVVKLVCPDSDSSPKFANASSEKSVDAVEPQCIFETIVSRKTLGSTDLKEKIDVVVKKLFPGAVFASRDIAK